MTLSQRERRVFPRPVLGIVLRTARMLSGAVQSASCILRCNSPRPGRLLTGPAWNDVPTCSPPTVTTIGDLSLLPVRPSRSRTVAATCCVLSRCPFGFFGFAGVMVMNPHRAGSSGINAKRPVGIDHRVRQSAVLINASQKCPFRLPRY